MVKKNMDETFKMIDDLVARVFQSRKEEEEEAGADSQATDEKEAQDQQGSADGVLPEVEDPTPDT